MKPECHHIDDLKKLESEYRATQYNDGVSFAEQMKAAVMADIIQGIASTMRDSKPPGWSCRSSGIREVTVDFPLAFYYDEPR